MSQTDGALLIQSDRSILLDLHAPRAEEARGAIAPFAELEKSPEHVHTYKITSLSLWNAAASGLDAPAIAEALEEHSRYSLPPHFLTQIRETISRYGKVRLIPDPERDDRFLLLCHNRAIAAEVGSHRKLGEILEVLGPDERGITRFGVKLMFRGYLKQEMIRIGWPVADEVPLREGEEMKIALREAPSPGWAGFVLRPYQKEAVRAFASDGRPGTGFGVIVLPCGSGKTIVGLQTMAEYQTSTLILTTNVSSVHQWIREVREKTSIDPGLVGEYTGQEKEVKPITIATYQILVWRPDQESDFPHFSLMKKRDWGLIIYDEVHLLPAPIFRFTAELQARRRLGLTATLVREDGHEEDVFSLVGPKRYDVPWRILEEQGWIAKALCTEVRIDLGEELQVPYAVATKREKYRISAENPAKIAVIAAIVEKHKGEGILVIGQYIKQLEIVAAMLNAPLITGAMPNRERDRLYDAFRSGDQRLLVVSKVANFAIDLPDASVAIQISGSFGSRQEEAQRLGRILRPKERTSHFYTLVSRHSVEEEFSSHRQRFLLEQGYKYQLKIGWDS